MHVVSSSNRARIGLALLSLTVAAAGRLSRRRRRPRATSTTNGARRRRSRDLAACSRRGCRTSACIRSRSRPKSSRAQQFINQGLNLAYGFNHAEAGRAFAEAARLDPSCAMAYWGQALVLGPEHQRGDDARTTSRRRCELVQKAVSLGARARRRASATTSTRWRSATPARPTDRAGGRSRVRRRDARAGEEVSARSRRRDDLRRVADGPAAVELLDARRPAARGHERGRSPRSSGCSPRTRSIRARCTTGSTCGSRPRRPNAPRRRPTGCCR